MATPRPLPVTPPGLLDDEDPGKWEKLKQVLWESNLNAPVRGIYNLMNTPYDVLMGGEGPEFDQAVADSFDAAGGITVGSMPMPKPSNSLSMGIKAYHGSPHSFDKFSMDKIGTGEGAQAYGHGLYFAENEGVARGYRDTLSGSMVSGAQKRLEKAGGDIDRAIADVQLRIDNYRANGAPQYADAIEEDLRGLLKFKETGEWTPGSMYEVEINADPNTFLDWDKPLSEQPESVRKAIMATKGNLPPNAKDDLGGDYSLIYGNDINPGQFLNTLEQIGGRPDFGENLLREAGIPGIKYLDAGSRNGTKIQQIEKQLAPWKARLEQNPNDAYVRQEVEGLQKDLAAEMAKPQSRNYVVFDDKLIDIIKKYGIAGLLGGSGLYGVSGDEAQAGAY